MSKLQEIRERNGLTRTQAAAKIGEECGKSVAYTTLYLWERGKTLPPLDAVEAMTKVYGVDLTTLTRAILE